MSIISFSVDSERADKINMEGKIVEKLECTPYADSIYMNMKAKTIKDYSQPKRKVEQLKDVVTNFKPVSDHKHNVRFFFIFFWPDFNCLYNFFRSIMRRRKKQMERNLAQTKM